MWIAGGLSELTSRLARAVPAANDHEAVMSLRMDLAGASHAMRSHTDDGTKRDVVWTLGRACGLAKALGLDHTDVAILHLSISYRNEPMLPGEPLVSTVDAVERAVEELSERFGDADG